MYDRRAGSARAGIGRDKSSSAFASAALQRRWAAYGSRSAGPLVRLSEGRLRPSSRFIDLCRGGAVYPKCPHNQNVIRTQLLGSQVFDLSDNGLAQNRCSDGAYIHRLRRFTNQQTLHLSGERERAHDQQHADWPSRQPSEPTQPTLRPNRSAAMRQIWREPLQCSRQTPQGWLSYPTHQMPRHAVPNIRDRLQPFLSLEDRIQPS
jgi:hypothetical protein